MLVTLAATGCSNNGPSRTVASTQAVTTSTAAEPAPPERPAARDRAVVHGRATLDGRPFDARFVGAVVLHDGLVTPCQFSLPPVTHGKYSITVYADTESKGCGAQGTRVALWTYARGKTMYSAESVDWPGNGRAAAFAPHFSTSAPHGAVPVTAQFSGSVFEGNDELPPGTTVEAYVGRTRCGVASVRASDGFTGYVLAVVGPDSIAACIRGARLSFHVNGKVAASAPVRNTPPGRQELLDLALL